MKYISMIIASIAALSVYGKEYKIVSPDNRIAVTVDVAGGSVTWRADYDGSQLIAPSKASIDILHNGKPLGGYVLKGTKAGAVNTIITPPVKEKRALIPDHYNERTFSFRSGIGLQFRVYDDAVAYRFTGDLPGEITVMGEGVNFNLPPQSQLYYSPSIKREDADIFQTSFEEPYFNAAIGDLSRDVYMFSPLLISIGDRPKVLVTESDIEDYPGMFLRKATEGTAVEAVFPGYPLKMDITEGEFKQKKAAERADYIAKTNGTRTFPWRVAAVAPKDADLLTNDIVYRLGRAPSFDDFSWTKPGKSTEEWITGLNLYGVDFRAGYNTETYKHYIDFAADFGFEYVMLDAGWSNVDDLFDITPGMDIEELCKYAAKKGVDMILWTSALTMEKQMDRALDRFKELGVKVVMTDFIDRNDQEAMGFMHRFARECADRELMCMIHGAPAPFGFSRTYPNMLTREGILGSEYNLWSTKANPDHDLMLPFIRMVAGPMDYEPGSLQNATQWRTEKGHFERVVAQGTRVHQMAMFVVYDSPLQLFSGNISDARRELEFISLLGKIPTVWDETVIIDAQLGRVVVEARRLGDQWYVAAMNNWEPYECSVPLDFLPAGVYNVEEASDGINADRNPHDYKIRNFEAGPNDSLTVKLAPGGGYVARIVAK